MKVVTKEKLVEAWNYCDSEDKSTEFMFQYMADTAGVEYDVAVSFVVNTPHEERMRISRTINNQNQENGKQ